MQEKIDLDLILDKNEEEYQKKQAEIYKKVIDEYSDLCNMNFRKESRLPDDYEVFDFLLQITTCKPQFFKEFHNILNKYGFNDKTYIDYAIKKITKNASNAKNFIDGLISTGMINEVNDLENNSIMLKSIFRTYNFFLANEYYFENQEIVSYIENGDTSRNCHVNTLFLLKCLKRGEAITAKCSTMFNNTFYHSYYRSNGIISDININCVMREEDYNSIYNPEIISVVNIENLEQKQNQVRENAKSTLNELLEIAVYEEIKKSNK